MSAAAEGQRIALDAYSAYTKTPVYAVGGETVFGLRQDVVLPDATDSKYTVPSQFAGRLDLIANFFYSAPQLWWVIAGANAIVDPLVEPVSGQIIRVPTRERVAKEGILNV